MASHIDIVDIFHRHKTIIVALKAESDHPLPWVVGCTLKCPDGQEIDIPHRQLKRSGTVLYGALTAPDACCLPMQNKHHQVWAGKVMFALWADDRFITRLADTGWRDWQAPYMLATSGASLDHADRMIFDEYGHDWAEAWVI